MKVGGQLSGFTSEKIKTNVPEGKISGFRVHRIKQDVKLIDKDLQSAIDRMYNSYNLYVLNIYSDLSKLVNSQFAKRVVRQYFLYGDRDKIRKNINLSDAVYLLEFEVTKESKTHVGDKLSSRFASKGIVSLILPDELRPYCQESGEPIDFIYNPFGVFSRMNLSQLIEVTCSKPTALTNRLIKENPNEADKYLTTLNETVIKHLGDDQYYTRIKNLIEIVKHDKNFRDQFVDEIRKNNLFIEAPSFSKINLRELINSATPKANENVVIPKKTINFMKQRLHCFQDLIISNDIVLPNIFVGPLYIQKLYKLVNKLITYRDFGPLKFVTQQPVRGRALGGGSSFGQMEIEAVLASGCDKAIRELLTVKNDWSSEKKNFILKLIKTGKYTLPERIPEDSSRTKSAINAILSFLKK